MKKLLIITTLVLLGIFAVIFSSNYSFSNVNYDFVLNTESINFDHDKLYENDNIDATVVLNPNGNMYDSKVVTETTKINISDELYNNYRGVGDVDHTVSLKPVKVASYNGIISFRYINNLNSTIDSMDMALDFRLELERSGYKLVINSDKKKVYEGDEYKVVILKEFNYLIIVIIDK